MEEGKVEERASESRIREAAGLGSLDGFVIACPKDYTMYQDAVKTTGYENQIRVLDLIDLVAEAI